MFSLKYAILYTLAGFAAGAYHINTGKSSRFIPVTGAAVCVIFVYLSFGFVYGFYTLIEYAIGFALSHVFFKPEKGGGDA